MYEPHETPEASINQSDARVFRELLLAMSADMHGVQTSTWHAKRSCLRITELERRASIPPGPTPLADLIGVIEVAVSRAIAIVNDGLDGGILALREIGDVVPEIDGRSLAN
jgi:hypothetical protein